MNSYTWNDLLADISKLTDEERNLPVRAGGDGYPFSDNVRLCRLSNNAYWHEDFGDECVYEDDLDSYRPEDCKLIAKKNTLYLDIS